MRQRQAEKRQTMQPWVDLSHDMRTPLSVILSSVQLLQARTGEACQPEAAQIERNVQQLMRLISNVLDITKLDAGYMDFTMQPLEVVAWLRYVADTCAPFAHTKGIEFVCATKDEALWVRCDEVKLERCVLNLVSNAVRHTPNGGLVCLSAECGEDEVIISVSDNGCGIPAARIRSLFERHDMREQLPGQTDGMGLGLPLVQSFMARMQGRIELESEWGEGTCAQLILPRIAPPATRQRRGTVISNTAVELSGLELSNN